MLMGKPRSFIPDHATIFIQGADPGSSRSWFLVVESTTIGFCLPFLGTIRTVFSMLKKEDVLKMFLREKLKEFWKF